MTQNLQNFGVIGGGAWGTALAMTLIRAGRDVTLWAYEAEVVGAIQQRHENTIYLPGVTLDTKLRATQDLKDVAACDAWLLVTPAQHTRQITQQLSELAGAHRTAPVIIAAKGIEQKTMSLLSDAVTACLPRNAVAILSGPSFAREVADNKPAALTLAIKDKNLGDNLLRAMASTNFRLYLSDDVVGAQIGGAVKNVLAVACGIVAGRDMGDNARAALITRGLAELMRFGVAMGGRAETLMGLSGMGDLVLTCSSHQSRNMSLGMALGQGKTLNEILVSRISVTEGVTTASVVCELAQKHGIDMPIVTAVDAVLNRGADIGTIIGGLLARPLKSE